MSLLRLTGPLLFSALILPMLTLTTSLANAQDQGLVLSDIPFPVENPISESKRILGKILFWEEQLSTDNSVACGTCHKPAIGGGDDRLAAHPGPDFQFDTDNETIGSPGIPLYNADLKAVDQASFGFAPQVTRRASQSIFTAMYADALFWDGRARDQLIDPLTNEIVIESGGALENQALVPVLSSIEMGHINRDWNDVTNKLAAATPLALASEIPADIVNALQEDSNYPALFRQAFADSAITPVRIAMAIATYERTLLPDQTPFDNYVQGNTSAMSADQISGWELFRDSVCSECHVPPLFTDNSFARTGLRTRFDDNGLQVFTKNTDDFGLFKVPSLRNVGLRKALTHVGWISDVQDAIDFYNAGTNDTRHTIFPNGLSEVSDPNNPGATLRINEINFFGNDAMKQAQVVDFLSNALTDPRVANETFPFDRPLLGSEKTVSGTTSTDKTVSISNITTRAIVNGALTPQTTFSSTDKISINQSLTINAADIGKAGSLFVVIVYDNNYYLRTSEGRFKPWNKKTADLLPAY